MAERRVALVTGSGRGIGRATAVKLAEQGADLAIHDIDGEAAEETAELVRKTGRRAHAYRGDVGDIEMMRAIVGRIGSEMGGVDILVNNAGIGSDRCPIEEVTLEMFERSMAIHVRGTLFTTQAVVPGMKARHFGRIINISSIQALAGWPDGATYNAAKGALLAMARGWAREFAPWGICVNAVAPGHTETEMTLKKDSPEKRAQKAKVIPLGRYATTGEIAHAVAFLASEDSGFITGQVLSPNGGFVIS